MALPAPRRGTCEGTYGRVRDIRFVDGRAWILTNNGDDDRLMSLPLSDVGAS